MENPNRNGAVVRTRRSRLVALLRLFDIAIITISLKLFLYFNEMSFGMYHGWWLLLIVVSFEFFAEFNFVYTTPRGINLKIETQKTVFTWLGVVLVLYFVIEAYPVFILGYEQMFWNWMAVVPPLLIFWHLLIRIITAYFRSLGRDKHRVAIIGATEIGVEIDKIIEKDSWLGLTFIGYFDDRANQESGRFFEKVQHTSGNIKDLIHLVNKNQIDKVYITLPLRAERRIKQIVEALADTTAIVFYVPDLFGFDLLRSKMDNLSGIPVISIHDTPFYDVNSFSKRLFDIIVSLFILALISVPLILIAIGIKLTSPGPILFKQRRYGFRGEEIVVWKFRSMTVCEDGGTVTQATKNDSRVTKFGKFLREKSLDELPQFFNVLQGKMSIIGPRPHAVAHNELYRGQIRGYMLRHKVKPGISGLAQVSGFRGETDTIEKMNGRVYYDLEYIRNWSLMLDIKIIFLTIYKSFFSEKAY